MIWSTLWVSQHRSEASNEGRIVQVRLLRGAAEGLHAWLALCNTTSWRRQGLHEQAALEVLGIADNVADCVVWGAERSSWTRHVLQLDNGEDGRCGVAATLPASLVPALCT